MDIKAIFQTLDLSYKQNKTMLKLNYLFSKVKASCKQVITGQISEQQSTVNWHLQNLKTRTQSLSNKTPDIWLIQVLIIN